MICTGWSLDQFYFADVCGNGQEAGERGGDSQCCIRTVGDYDAAQDC